MNRLDRLLVVKVLARALLNRLNFVFQFPIRTLKYFRGQSLVLTFQWTRNLRVSIQLENVFFSADKKLIAFAESFNFLKEKISRRQILVIIMLPVVMERKTFHADHGKEFSHVSCTLIETNKNFSIKNIFHFSNTERYRLISSLVHSHGALLAKLINI